MPRGLLRQLDVFRLVVEVGQNRGAEAAGRDVLRKADIAGAGRSERNSGVSRRSFRNGYAVWPEWARRSSGTGAPFDRNMQFTQSR